MRYFCLLWFILCLWNLLVQWFILLLWIFRSTTIHSSAMVLSHQADSLGIQELSTFTVHSYTTLLYATLIPLVYHDTYGSSGFTLQFRNFHKWWFRLLRFTHWQWYRLLFSWFTLRSRYFRLWGFTPHPCCFRRGGDSLFVHVTFYQDWFTLLRMKLTCLRFTLQQWNS